MFLKVQFELINIGFQIFKFVIFLNLCYVNSQVPLQFVKLILQSFKPTFWKLKCAKNLFLKLLLSILNHLISFNHLLIKARLFIQLILYVKLNRIHFVHIELQKFFLTRILELFKLLNSLQQRGLKFGNFVFGWFRDVAWAPKILCNLLQKLLANLFGRLHGLNFRARLKCFIAGSSLLHCL